MSPRPKALARDDELPDGEPASIKRRAPFAVSPSVGERGQKAQLRILEAALDVFGEVGYHACGIKRITEVSGYSRASFYQYFSSKEDVFRHLAGRVARELTELAATIDPISPDQTGWESFHEWLRRYSEIYDTYEAVFVTFQTAVANDAAVASGAAVVTKRSFDDLRSRIVGSTLRPKELDSVIRTLLETVGRLNREAELLELVAPAASLDRARANVACADVFHRTLFGPISGVNVHVSKRRVKRVRAPALLTSIFDVSGDPAHGPAAQRTRAELLEAGHKVFIDKGYYKARVSDIVKEAGKSHGVFYRYFENKTHLFRILAEQASLELNAALRSLRSPFAANDMAAPDELRSWLRRYADTYASQAAIFTMWNEAISRDAELFEVSAAVIDGSRAQLARYLAPRGWGDIEADALVLLVFLDAMTGHPSTPARIESTARMIELGLLTGPATAGASRPSRARSKAPTAQRTATARRTKASPVR